MAAALKLVQPAPSSSATAAPAPRKRSELRFITCGSVDDGKSTLIGRVLFESGAVFEDHLATLDRDSKKFGTNGENLDFALLVDGLSAEREQGITIDVAYRYFATRNRSFIVADTPGHEQYTRNMATGASTADLAVLVVDARKGLLPQTRRHSFIVSMVGVRHVILAVNKMDLVDFDETVFRTIEADYLAAVADLGFRSIACVPISAREGDNLTKPSAKTPWYDGAALLPLLETIDVDGAERAAGGFAMPVQWVNRPNADFRGFSGTIATGEVAVGDLVSALPSRRESRIAGIVTADGDLNVAGAGQAVTLTLEDEIDLSRGDVIASPAGARATIRPRIRTEITARLIVTGERKIAAGETFLIKLATTLATATVIGVDCAIDISTYSPVAAAQLSMNAIGVVRLRIDRPIVVTDYAASHDLGGFILIDRIGNETSAFGFVLPDAPTRAQVPENTSTIARLRAALLRYLGQPGTEERRVRLQELSWRFVSAAIVFALVWFFAGSPAAGGAAGFADLVVRPLVRYAHGRLWARPRRIPADELSDGGGI
jgi:bifunctional enzyme CysN/CysC